MHLDDMGVVMPRCSEAVVLTVVGREAARMADGRALAVNGHLAEAWRRRVVEAATRTGRGRPWWLTELLAVEIEQSVPADAVLTAIAHETLSALRGIVYARTEQVLRLSLTKQRNQRGMPSVRIAFAVVPR